MAGFVNEKARVVCVVGDEGQTVFQCMRLGIIIRYTHKMMLGIYEDIQRKLKHLRVYMKVVNGDILIFRAQHDS